MPQDAVSSQATTWHLYMLRLPNGMLYTGITTDVQRRLAQHQAGKGAKSLRGKGELTLAFHCPAGDRSLALRLEYRVKQLSKKQKERLVSHPPLSLEHLLPQVKIG
ncbi:GIY-YIG nuclease family protein [Serratia sp. AKBS12]|uniref:GIY-YIG nuclease family protein n=1 Tax=Serratia sp. AKBS12 TaxID=2974597 RepID=UPI0021663B34|nr:GIY-YIG nuclease family protein [Serratia sp. AKBS12]MCS3405994.1 GIY-YIG nuclease family protein [Serratia sp. AKBS12]HEI8867811.1 GIY-YIG nuclease family protein [Serratia odorifera]